MTTSRQRLSPRVLWFGVGAVLNYVLIAVPFRWLSAHAHWPVWVSSACSVGVAAIFFLAWNVFVNFRTDGRLATVLPRYLPAAAGMWLLSSAVLTVLKHIDVNLASKVGNIPLDFDVIGTQCFLAGLKFVLYHSWVFPVGTADAEKPT